MKQFGTFFIVIALFSCHSPGKNKTPADTAKSSNNAPGVSHLMVYYPKGSTDAQGNVRTADLTIPDIQLTAQNGKPYNTSSLKGHVSVCDFFFTRCKGTCPVMTSQLTRVQAALHNEHDLKLLSFTVDPANDTAQILQAYADHFRADTSQWTFVTGPKKEIYDLARYSFYLPVQPGNGDSEDFIHSDQLILLDRQERIRGYYPGTDSTGVDSLVNDVKLLLNEKK